MRELPRSGHGSITSLVFSKLYRLVHDKLVRVRLGIEAVEGLQSDGEVAGADIYRAPRRHSLELVDFGLYVFEVSLSEALDGSALRKLAGSSPERKKRNTPIFIYLDQVP